MNCSNVPILPCTGEGAGRNTLRFHDSAMQAALEDRTALEKDLHNALAENQLRLYYQMQADHSGHIHGAEVLIRWQHPERGLVPPLEFIPLAEETGLILPIGQWVLETACAQLKAWEADPLARDLQLAVNVSARQFRQADFVEQVCAMLEKSAINPTGSSSNSRRAWCWKTSMTPSSRCRHSSRSECTSPWMTSAPAIHRWLT